MPTRKLRFAVTVSPPSRQARGLATALCQVAIDATAGEDQRLASASARSTRTAASRSAPSAAKLHSDRLRCHAVNVSRACRTGGSARYKIDLLPAATGNATYPARSAGFARSKRASVPSWIDRCGRHSRCRGIDRTGLRFGEAAFPKRLEPYGLLWIDQALNRGRGRSFAFSITERSPR